MLFRFLFIEAVKTYQKLFAWANVSVGSYVGCVLALNSVGTLASGEETLKGGGRSILEIRSESDDHSAPNKFTVDQIVVRSLCAGAEQIHTGLPVEETSPALQRCLFVLEIQLVQRNSNTQLIQRCIQ